MNRRTLIWVIIPQGRFSPSTTTAAWYQIYQRCKTWGHGTTTWILMYIKEFTAMEAFSFCHGWMALTVWKRIIIIAFRKFYNGCVPNQKRVPFTAAL